MPVRHCSNRDEKECQDLWQMAAENDTQNENGEVVTP